MGVKMSFKISTKSVYKRKKGGMRSFEGTNEILSQKLFNCAIKKPRKRLLDLSCKYFQKDFLVVFELVRD